MDILEHYINYIRRCDKCLFKNFPVEKYPCKGCTPLSCHFVDKVNSLNLDIWEKQFSEEIEKYNKIAEKTTKDFYEKELGKELYKLNKRS